MSTITVIARVVFSLLFIISLYDVTVSTDSPRQIIEKSQKVLATGNSFITNINKIITPIKQFSKISEFLGKLGPAAMAVSSALTLIKMFLPEEPEEISAELKLINEGFEKVNKKLDDITSQIGNLENIIEFSSAKSTFVASMTIINSNYETLETARKKDTKENYKFFAKQYENTFALATDKIYDSLVGTHGSMGFDIVNLYRIHSKCNPVLLAQFCTKGLQLITKGMEIEGAYMGFYNFSNKAITKSESWKGKLDVLSQHCSKRIQDCELDWKTYAYQQFKDTYKEIGGDNQAFADRLAKDIDNVAPTRSWLAVVYNDANGFGPHTFSSYYEVEKIWHERDHCATLVSQTREPELTGSDLDGLKKLIQTQVSLAEQVNDCDTQVNWLIPANRYDGEHARFIVNKIRETYNTGFVNAVNVDHKPGVTATGNTLHVTTVKWRCTSSPFALIIFQ